MDDQVENRPSITLHPATHIGLATLTVANLSQQIAFYTEAIGLTIISRMKHVALLGVEGVEGVEKSPLLLLREDGEVRSRPFPSTGLYHIAFRVPTRADLGRTLRHLAESGYPVAGAADHLVSEAIYLSDPEGNGLEIYRDRPRSAWPMLGTEVQMASDPLDMQGILADGDSDRERWSGMRAGTDIGHMHLQVANIREAEGFYSGILGFSIMQKFQGALFVAAGGYHHHIGLNTWQSRNAPRPPAHATGLGLFTIALPHLEALQEVVERLYKANISFNEQANDVVLNDPWGNGIVLTARPFLSVETILEFEDRHLLKV